MICEVVVIIATVTYRHNQPATLRAVPRCVSGQELKRLKTTGRLAKVKIPKVAVSPAPPAVEIDQVPL